MSIFTLTINNFGTSLDRQVHEVERIHRYLHAAAQDIRSAGGKKTSGNILDINNVVAGSWAYTPQAAT